MAGLAVRTCCAGVPVIDVEAAREAHVLVSKIFHDVREHGIVVVPSPTHAMLSAGGDVRNRLISCRHRRGNSIVADRAAAPMGA